MKIPLNSPVISHYLNFTSNGDYTLVAVISDDWDEHLDHTQPDSKTDPKMIYARPFVVATATCDGNLIKTINIALAPFATQEHKTFFASYFNKDYMANLVYDALCELGNISNGEAPVAHRKSVYGTLTFASDLDEIVAKVNGEIVCAEWEALAYNRAKNDDIMGR